MRRRSAVAGGAIRFERVRFHYGNHAEPLFDDLSVTIAAGERVALVGHSGSGKTTFVKLLQRLHEIQGGRILIDGQDIAGATLASLREAIALVPQEPVLFHRSLAENIAYARPDASHDEIVRAARLAHADGFIERLPQGYATLVGERGVKLSGGERQRVAIARAILADRPILVLDEATSSLDSEAEQLIQDALEHLMAGRTTLGDRPPAVDRAQGRPHPGVRAWPDRGAGAASRAPRPARRALSRPLPDAGGRHGGAAAGRRLSGAQCTAVARGPGTLSRWPARSRAWASACAASHSACAR